MRPRMKAVLIGAGGHARVVLDAARSALALEIVAVIDAKRELAGTRFEGVDVLGDESALPAARERGAIAVLLGVGSIDVGDARRSLYERLSTLGLDMPIVIHRAATVSPTATLGPATVVFAGVVINPGARVGTNVILNTSCVIEHDVRIGDHTHVSPGAHIARGVAIGTCS